MLHPLRRFCRPLHARHGRPLHAKVAAKRDCVPTPLGRFDSPFDAIFKSVDPFGDAFFSGRPLWSVFSHPSVARALAHDAMPTRADGRALMPTDISESDSGFSLRIQLPGVPKDNLNVEIHEGIITVSSDHKAEPSANEGKPLHRETVDTHMSRSWRIPEDVLQDKVSCEMKDGILSVSLPKRPAPEEPQPRKIDVS